MRRSRESPSRNRLPSLHQNLSEMPDTAYDRPTPEYRRQDPYDDEISLLDLAITLAKHKKLIIGLPLVVAAVTAVATMLMPATYTATTKLLPSGNANTLITLLQSQPMQDSLVARFRLQEAYGTATIGDTRKALEGASSFKADKDGTIAVEVSDADSERAAGMANAYPALLRPLALDFILTPAAQRRMLFEKQLPDAEEALRQADAAMESARKKASALKLDTKVESLVREASALRARIAMKEVEIVVLGSMDPANLSDGLPRQQLNALWEELSTVEQSTEFTANVPDAGRAYLRAIGARKYAETRLEALHRQIDLAKVAEQREAPMVQVLDRADVPLHRSKPQRSKIVLIAALAAGFLAVLWAFVAEALRNAANDREQQPKLQLLKESLGWK